jgi:hypothetical protein
VGPTAASRAAFATLAPAAFRADPRAQARDARDGEDTYPCHACDLAVTFSAWLAGPVEPGPGHGRQQTKEATTQTHSTEDLIESRVGVHDSNHFEVKLDYCLDSTRPHSRYRVECYLFVPRSLGVNRLSYPREQFYSDVQGYIRFKTPLIGLKTLADANDPMSPLATIDSSIEALRHDPRNLELRRQLSHELRMFGCVARAQLRDRIAGIREAIHSQVAPEDVALLVERLIADLDPLLAAWRARRIEFIAKELPEIVCETYTGTDEYLSQILEHELTGLVSQLDHASAGAARAQALVEVRARVIAELLAERSYRERSHYEGPDDGDPELYVFRRGMLKKLVNSVLWLEISKQKEGRGIGNLGAAIAAGAAMAFALVAALLGARLGARWYVTDTWGFVVAGTITYIFKDRIKDWLKGFFSSQTGRWLADYATEIRDPVSGSEIGRCRESLAYHEPDAVPREVLALRHAQTPTALESDAKPEVVIKYEKDVRLNGARLIERLHLGDYEINDIMRFCVTPFLVRADDPIMSLPVYDRERDVIRHREFHKTYHLNLIMVMRCAHDAAPVMQHVRVVFDKHGIRRLEQPAGPGEGPRLGAALRACVRSSA